MAHETLSAVMAGLMTRYQDRVPNVQRVLDLMMAEELLAAPGDIENDHIAFRTMGVPQLGICLLYTSPSPRDS